MQKIIISIIMSLVIFVKSNAQDNIYQMLKALSSESDTTAYNAAVKQAKTWSENEFEKLMPFTLNKDKKIQQAVIIAMVVPHEFWNNLYQLGQKKENQENFYEAEVYYLASYYHARRFAFRIGGNEGLENLRKIKARLTKGFAEFDIDIEKKEKEEEKKDFSIFEAMDLFPKKISKMKLKITKPEEIAFIDNISGMIETKFPLD